MASVTAVGGRMRTRKYVGGGPGDLSRGPVRAAHDEHPAWPAEQPHGNAAAQQDLTSATTSAGEVVGQAPGKVRRLLDLVADQAPLAVIAGLDRDAARISGEDWYMGHGYLPELIPQLHSHASSTEAVQDTLWFLYEMTELEADIGLQRVYDLESGAIRAVPLAPGSSRDRVATGSRLARAQLTANQHIVDNKLVEDGWVWDDFYDPVALTRKEHFERSVSAAMSARVRLRAEFGFDPDDRSLDAVRALRGTLDGRRIQAFMDAYLTAFFVSGAPPGAGLTYAYERVKGVLPSVFFGNPPGCDQLPDGRGIIDCKGFVAVSQLLFRELSDAEVNGRGSKDVTYQFIVPRHQMSLIRSRDVVMAVDNDNVVILPMGTAELRHLDRLHESSFADGRRDAAQPLTGRIDLEALPSLRAFVVSVFQKYHLTGEIRAAWYAAIPALT